MTKEKDVHTSVLIVGGGPVGLGMAIELGWRGIDCILVDQGDGAALLPRASGVSVRTMEICRRWGIVDDLFHGGFPTDYNLDTIYCTSVAGFELERNISPAIDKQEPLAFSPENKFRLPQNMLDPVLERAARRFPSVAIRRLSQLVGFEETADGVTAYIEPLNSAGDYDFNRSGTAIGHSRAALKTDRGHAIHARYMVACDGVMSGVRDALAIPTVGTGRDGNAVLGYSISALLRIEGLNNYHQKGEAERFVFVGTDGIWGNLTTVDARDRWRLTLAGTVDKLDLSTIDMEAEVGRCLGRDDIPFEIEFVTPWRRRQMVATTFQQGRVFLAGDAAHAMSPTGGFGMNTGIGDVFDLGWKIEASLAGWGGAGLLESYDTERGPIAWRNVRAAASNFHPWRMQLDFSHILEETEQAETDRETIGTTIKDAFEPEWTSWGVTLGYRYEGSSICVADGTPATPDDPMAYIPTTRPGSRAPHGWLADGRSTLDLFGRGFTLLCLGADAREAQGLVEAAAARGVPLNLVAIDDASITALYERRFVLVRPDGHVAWRADTLPVDPATIIDTVRGALGSDPAAARSLGEAAA